MDCIPHVSLYSYRGSMSRAVSNPFLLGLGLRFRVLGVGFRV